jgi:lactoylglutathione lyase
VALMPQILVNIDVPDVEHGIRFYTEAFGLRVGRRLGQDFVELLGAEAPIYLLHQHAGSAPFASALAKRSYDRHWTPVHLDFRVVELDAAVARAEAAGAKREGELSEHAWGRMALFSDPFGHGVCLLQFQRSGYDELIVRASGSRSLV